jgi:acyl-CoA synthetase (AMP-forming)/AMP-acid ligase II
MGQAGVTHVSGTPSHWRKALSIGAPKLIAPAYVRLSGEIADQVILNQLTAAFPDASVGHAYASTEAGVGFEVNDGLEGVPANLLEGRTGEVETKVVDGSLRIRSNRTAKRYVGASGVALADADGFVDTGDMVELRDNRYYFKGRRGGIINVGGLKVHPEEIEGVINSYPGVRVSLAYGRRNPLTGFIVVAEVVLEDDQAATGTKIDEVKIRGDILRFCHDRLAAFKVPALLRFVPTLRMTEGGKLLRERA